MVTEGLRSALFICVSENACKKATRQQPYLMLLILFAVCVCVWGGCLGFRGMPTVVHATIKICPQSVETRQVSASGHCGGTHKLDRPLGFL